mmetsp:Transcript_7870/g.10319  ORF Transcript_7870/g.10319 Transcript_7870/m.10319 type:complete len:850 (-) Transcript_7870:34-2583(-)
MIGASILCLLPIVAVCFSSQPKVFGSRPQQQQAHGPQQLQRHPLLDLSDDATFVWNRVRSDRRRQRSETTCLNAGFSANEEGGARNMFHDYKKPIVLIGKSSSLENVELMKLAESLQEQDDFFATRKSRIYVPESFKGGLDSDIVVSDERLISGLVSDSQDYQWPDVIVMDTNSCAGGGNEEACLELARSLHEDVGLLSIYVNVEPTNDSKRTEDDQALKNKQEQDIFLPFTDYELCVRNEGTDDPPFTKTDFTWEHVEWELTRLLARARLIPAIPGDTTRSANTAHLTMGDNTFFLSLSFPDIRQVQEYTSQMCLDVDAMEYRTDLLDCRDSRFDVIYGMQLLRSYCRPNAVRVPGLPLAGGVLEDVFPIVYTVRTQNQAGTYPDDEAGIERMFQMLEWGLRSGVEVLDVESAWDFVLTNRLLNMAESRYSSQILGSHHVVNEEVTTEDAVLLFEQCALNGRAHGAKVVLSIESEEKDRMAYEAGLITAELAREEGNPVIPHISLILGDVGQFSRVINLPFTPVTHESLTSKAAPGQLTAMEIMTTRLLTRIFQPRKYAILGHNIAYSVSPQMQGGAFLATKLPNEYVRADVATVEEFMESDLVTSADFGGCSVTIPHKQAIIPYMDVLSDAAQRIGSVNTVIAKEEFVGDAFNRVLYGDNTDWKGIFNPLERLLGGSVDPEKDVALILGAGGTARAAAFVAEKLGLGRVYYNRTPSKATELKESFGGTVVESLDQSSEGGKALGDLLVTEGKRVRVVISTLPATAGFELPSWVLENPSLPIVFDVNYKPYQTKLLEQAEEKGCAVVRGSEMLWEQGAGQFELWTGRTAPYAVMKQIVLENCFTSVLE